jgi:hypothetical protein
MVALGFPENHPHVVLLVGFALKEAQASGPASANREGPGAVARCTQSSHGFMGFLINGFLDVFVRYIMVYL